jgi:hypothetical protein
MLQWDISTHRLALQCSRQKAGLATTPEMKCLIQRRLLLRTRQIDVLEIPLLICSNSLSWSFLAVVIVHAISWIIHNYYNYNVDGYFQVSTVFLCAWIEF